MSKNTNTTTIDSALSKNDAGESAPASGPIYYIHCKPSTYHCIKRPWTNEGHSVPVSELSADEVAELKCDPWIVIAGPFLLVDSEQS